MTDNDYAARCGELRSRLKSSDRALKQALEILEQSSNPEASQVVLEIKLQIELNAEVLES